MLQKVRQVEGANWGIEMNPQADYVFLGRHLTVIPDAVYPYDLSIVRRIRAEFDGGFVPITRKMWYRSRAHGILCITTHGVARYDPRAEFDWRLQDITMPIFGPGSDLPKPNMIDRWLTAPLAEGSIRHRNNLPPPSLPWGDWILAWAREAYDAESMVNKLKKTTAAAEALKTAEKNAEQSETEYRQQQDRQFQKRLLDKLGSDDIREAKARATGHVVEETRPFVDLGSA